MIYVLGSLTSLGLKGIGRTSGTAGWVVSYSQLTPFTMDVHSSSLLSSNAPAPDQLAEEHSALSHVYSDVRSNTPESSPQPLPCSLGTSQDATDEPTVESTLIAQIVDDLKILRFHEISQRKLMTFSENVNNWNNAKVSTKCWFLKR